MNEHLEKLGIFYDAEAQSWFVAKQDHTTYHDDLEDAVWNGIFGFCPCGEPPKELERMYCIMENIGKGAEERQLPSDEDMIYLYVLDSAGMTGHGSTVRGSWLNDEGRHLMEVLDRLYNISEKRRKMVTCTDCARFGTEGDVMYCFKKKMFNPSATEECRYDFRMKGK